MPTRTPVLIIGAGPVGLALAGDLGWRGIPCILLEKGDGSIYQPRMDLVGIRTMEFCRRWGIVEWVENCPYPRDYKQDYVWVYSITGWEYGRQAFPTLQDEQPPSESPQKRERCPQDMFDPILTRFVRSYAKSEIRYHSELVAFSESDAAVTATVCNGQTGQEEMFEADYMIGCDGAASTVRQQLGIPMSGNPVLTYTTNAIFRCPNWLSMHDKGEAYRFIVIQEEGTFATIVAINGRDRFRFSMVGGDEKRAYTEAEMRAAIVRAVGREFEFEILSIMPWVRRELVADSYGTQRVFLGGDAAHLTSPTGAFGMNMGIQDSVDLGWKLEACLRGWGGPRLLQSYEIERRPVAIRNVQEASGNLRRMLGPRVQRPPKAAFEDGPEGDRARREFGDAYTQEMAREWFANGIHLGYRYESSPIVVPDGTPEPPDTVSTYTQTARPGHRAPHAWLKDGRSTLDLFGRSFVLLRFGREPAPADGLKKAALDRHVPLDIVDIDETHVAELYENRLVLVRPDGHVAWRADVEPTTPEQIIDQIRGAGSVTRLDLNRQPRGFAAQ